MNAKLTDVIVTKHAADQAESRFNVNDPYNWVRQKAKSADFISVICNSQGKPARLFAKKGVCLAVDYTEDKVITVYEGNKSPISDKLARFAKKELAKAEKDEVRTIRKADILRGEIEMELGELRIKLARSRSLPKQLAYKARISALEMRLADLPEEKNEARRKKTQVVKGFAAFV